MEKICLDEISHHYVNERIDKILAEILEISRNQIQRYIEEGFITVCGKRVNKSYKIKKHDCINIIIPPPKDVIIVPRDAPIRIVYEDGDVVVVDKPAGVVVHPGAAWEESSVVSALIYRGIKLSNVGAPLRPGVVHRIDKDTSGIIVLAKTDAAHFNLARQFFEHTIERVYLGISSKHLETSEGFVDWEIGRHPKNRKLFSVVKKGKPAKTYYKVIKKLANHDIVMFKLFTGRTHQIRVHMKAIGCPLLGDVVYGKKTELIRRQALHAYKLGFIHPVTKQKMVFYSKLPDDMLRIIVGG